MAQGFREQYAKARSLGGHVNSFTGVAILAGYLAVMYYVWLRQFFPANARPFAALVTNPFILASYAVLLVWWLDLDFLWYRVERPENRKIARRPAQIEAVLVRYRGLYGDDRFYRAHRVLGWVFVILFGIGTLVAGFMGPR